MMHQVAVKGEEAMRSDEQREKRKKNMGLYRVPEIQSDDTSKSWRLFCFCMSAMCVMMYWVLLLAVVMLSGGVV